MHNIDIIRGFSIVKYVYMIDYSEEKMKRILGIFLAIIMLISTMCLTCSCVETFETEYKNLAYVEGKANGYEALDIYLPDDHGGPFPVLVFVHG